ncbi:S ribonuclease [Pyrus ussuriensis x Pyrus communis]|uniref:S ribonuclease n=1 Tax=Pyrus ussuriensis x Pyrus communis TaxID=2448454 RepID=A0A5N5HCJ0_9ROSA|nr:S ribonuclease [Pyrus ussuriensis x Pyrus communis]
MICHSGRWVTFDKEKKYFLEIVLKIMCCGVDIVTLAYSIPIGSHANKVYSLAVIGTRVIPIYVSMLHILGSMNPPPTKVPLWSDATFKVKSTLVLFEDINDIDWVTMRSTFTTRNVMSMANSNEVQLNGGVRVENRKGSEEFRIAKDEVSHRCDLAFHMMREKFNDPDMVYSAKDVVRNVKATLGVMVSYNLVAKYLNDVDVEKWSQAQMNGKRHNLASTYYSRITWESAYPVSYSVFPALQWNVKRAAERKLLLPPTGKVKLLKYKPKQCSYEDSVSQLKVSKELEMKKKKKAYKVGVEFFLAYANLRRRLF